jgi:hypothetical protein
MSNPNLVIKYGAFVADFNSLPEASLVAMLRRGTAHFFGSEQASKVTAHFDPENESPVEDTPEARAAFKAECQAKAMAALVAGTVGVSTRGPAVDPITTIIRRLAKAEVVAILKSNSLAWPKKAEDTVSFPNGDKFTGAQLIDRRVAREGDRLAKEAKKIADEQARRNKKAEEAANAEGLGGL